MTAGEIHWKDVTVRVEETTSGGTFHISGHSIPFRFLAPDYIEIDGKPYRFYVLRDRNSYTVWLNGRTYHLKRVEKGPLAQSTPAEAGGNIIAFMPGKLLHLEVSVGDTVVEKQTVAIMESMKMESSLHAPISGRVVEIRCQPGQAVEMGEILIVIE